MPYDSIQDLPEAVRKLPEKAQEIFMGAFNGAWEQYKDLGPKEREARAFAVAWSATRKAGFKTQSHPSIHQKAFGKMKISKDGSAIFYGATVFAEGEWTDSASMTATTYTAEEIAKTAHLWDGIDLWHDHPGGSAHTHQPADNIGKIKNPRMRGGELVTDLHAHGKTQASRDAIGMWQSGIMPDLSAEMSSKDVRKGGKTYGTELTPFGVAWVIEGACDVCKIDTHTMHVGARMAGAASNEKITGGGHMADEKEMKELQAELEIMKAETKELKGCKDKAQKEMTAAKSEHEQKVKELEKALADKGELKKDDRIKELEAQVKVLEDPEGQIKELAKVKAELEKKTGTEVEKLTTRIKELEDLPNARSKRFSEGREETGETKLHSNFVRSKNGDVELKVR